MENFSLFDTPVFVSDILEMNEVNQELTERLQAESRTSPGVRRANIGGWHSAPDIATRTEECYRHVTRMIISQVGGIHSTLTGGNRSTASHSWQFGVQSWAMVMRQGDYTVLHDHGEAHWSATYYVDAGDADQRSPESGALALVDPRRGGRSIPGIESGSTFMIRPRSGMLVVFPGWLQHYVHPYRGARPRIAIASNVVMSP